MNVKYIILKGDYSQYKNEILNMQF